jgi:CheY-like chemotaxis protein
MSMADQREAVLVVEDEPLLRFIIVEELELEGFEVFQASGAGEAIDVLESTQHIRVLFTDVDLSSAGEGLILGRLVRSRWPPIKIIVTSGNWGLTDDEIDFAERFLPKPYVEGVIVDTIRECLASMH